MHLYGELRYLLPLAAAVEVAFIRLADDGDLGIFVVLSVFLFFGFVAGRSGGSNGQDSGDNELNRSRKIRFLKLTMLLIKFKFYCLPASC